MGGFKRYNLSISCVLSAGLVCGPYDCQFPDELDYRYSSVESLGLEELGLDKKVKKLVKPVMDLTAASGVKTMAVTTVQFIRNLNDMFGTKYTIDDGLYQSALIMQKNGARVDQNKFAALQKLLQRAEKSLSPDMGYDLKKPNKEFGNMDQMCDEEALGYMFMLAGALLMIIPTPVTMGIGSGMVTMGLGLAVQYAGKEKEDKRKS